MDDIGPSNRIELGAENPAYSDGRTYAEGINIHMAGIDNFTGIGQNGKAVSEGCLLIDRNKWNNFINTFNNSEQRNNIISITVSRTYQAPTNQDSPLLRFLNPGGWILP